MKKATGAGSESCASGHYQDVYAGPNSVGLVTRGEKRWKGKPINFNFTFNSK